MHAVSGSLHAMQTVEDQRRRNKSMKEIKKKALDLQDQIRKEINLMMQTATVPDR